MIGALLLIIAAGIDAAAVGSRSWRDAAAFVGVVLGSFALWARTDAADTFAAWLIDAASWLGGVTGADWSARDSVTLVTALIGLLAVGSLLAIIPDHLLSGGRMAALQALSSRLSLAPKRDSRLNPRVWVLGITLGMLAPAADVPGTAWLIVSSIPPLAGEFLAALGGGS